MPNLTPDRIRLPVLLLSLAARHTVDITVDIAVLGRGDIP